MGTTTFSGPVVSQGGFIDSSFTTAERDAIVNPQPGLLIYNTDENNYQVFTGTAWDSAFGPGGGGASGFPYLLTNLTTYSAPATVIGTSYASKILFNPTGTQALTVANAGFNVVGLTTPYDLSTTFTASVYPTATNQFPLGSYFNADGTMIYVLNGNAGNASVIVRSYNLYIAYDLSTLNAGSETFVSEFYIGSSMSMEMARGSELSADGTKLMFSVTGSGNYSYLRTYTLAAPYDFASTSFTSGADITSAVQALHYMGSSTVYGLAVNSTGTVVYTSVNGYSGAPSFSPTTYILEFKLGTAYDVGSSSLQAIYSQATSAGTDLGNSNNGLTLANSNIYIGNSSMMYGGANWNLNSLTALSVPNITGVSPSSGTTGTLVTITGTGFTGTTSVAFGSGVVQSTSINVVNDTQIQVVVPNTGTNSPVDVVVTNPAGSSTEVAAFTNTSPPVTTYSRNVNYGNNGVTWYGMGGSNLQVQIGQFQWYNITEANNVINTPSGTQISFETNYGTVIGVLTTGFSGGAGVYTAQLSASTYPPVPTMGYEQVSSISI